jgi:hypothetical protein
MSALTVAEASATTALEQSFAQDLGSRRARPGPGAAPALPRVRPLRDPHPPRVTPAPQRVPSPSTERRPAVGPPPTLRSRVRVLRAADAETLGDPDVVETEVPDGDPRSVAHALALASVEALVGRRSVAQLARWLAPGVYEALRARAGATLRAAGPAAPGRAVVVRALRVCAVDRHVLEVSAVVDDGRRVRAVALRLDSHRRTWRVTALEIG